jgi:hypothetical protein
LIEGKNKTIAQDLSRKDQKMNTHQRTTMKIEIKFINVRKENKREKRTKGKYGIKGWTNSNLVSPK